MIDAEWNGSSRTMYTIALKAYCQWVFWCDFCCCCLCRFFCRNKDCMMCLFVSIVHVASDGCGKLRPEIHWVQDVVFSPSFKLFCFLFASSSILIGKIGQHECDTNLSISIHPGITMEALYEGFVVVMMLLLHNCNIWLDQNLGFIFFTLIEQS